MADLNVVFSLKQYVFFAADILHIRTENYSLELAQLNRIRQAFILFCPKYIFAGEEEFILFNVVQRH